MSDQDFGGKNLKSLEGFVLLYLNPGDKDTHAYQHDRSLSWVRCVQLQENSKSAWCHC